MSHGLTIVVVFLTCLSTCSAQESSSQLAELPIVVVKYGGVANDAAELYVRRLYEELNIGQNIAAQAASDATKSHRTIHRNPVAGMLVHMGVGLLPSAEQIQFSEVVDHAEFVRLVHTRSASLGAESSLEGSEDRFKYVTKTTWRVSIDDAEDDGGISDDGSIPVDGENDAQEKSANQVVVKVGVGSGTGVVVQANSMDEGELIEENGVKYRQHSATTVSYFRFHDGFMYESQSQSLWGISLPSGDSLRQLDHSEVNGEVTFYPDRIPMGLRHLGWSALSTAAGAELQQRDEEAELAYSLRRSFGDAGLSLIQSIIFDTEQISAWMKFADDDNPIRGQFRISSRQNSDLGKTLREVASADRRFAPILNDNAAGTFHTAIRLPEVWRKTLDALWTVLAPEFDPAVQAPQLQSASKSIGQSLRSLSQHGNIELCAKIGWTQESGGVIYGGVQLDDNPELLTSMLAILTADSQPDVIYELVELSDRQMLKISMASGGDMGIVRLSHVYVAQANSCLWFAAGGEDAHEIIHQSINRCAESTGRIISPVITLTVDLQRWSDYPQDDATGLTVLHKESLSLFQSLAFVITDIWEFQQEPSDDAAIGKQQSLFSRAMDLGGSRQGSVIVDMDESGLIVSGTVGAAVARGYAALLLSGLDQFAQPASPIAEGPTVPAVN